MIIGVGMVSTILIIVQEKPVARLLLTPVKRIEILLAKYITYISILIVQNISLVMFAFNIDFLTVFLIYRYKIIIKEIFEKIRELLISSFFYLIQNCLRFYLL